MTDNRVLSEREREVLRLVAAGSSNKIIAQQLSISSNTVKVHLRNIFSKIGAASRTEAALYAVRQGLVEALPRVLESPQAESHPRPAFPAGGRRDRWSILVLAGILLAVGVALAVEVAGRRHASPSTAAAIAATPTVMPRWQARSAMPEPRSRFGAAVYQEVVYAIGGDVKGLTTGAVERYDQRTDSWRSLASKPVPVADVGAAVIGGRIYVPGGRTLTGRITDILEIYDPRLDVWVEGPRMPRPLSEYALAAFEGKLLVFGGWDGTGFVASVYEFDPDTAKWQARTPMPTARGLAGATVAGGRVFVIGGLGSDGPLSANEEYVPAHELTGRSPWIVRGPMPEPRYAMGVASIADQVYVSAAQSTHSTMSGLLEYSPSRDGWERVPSPDEPLPTHSALIAVGPMLYCFGGQTETGREPRLWSYQVVFTLAIPYVR